jgi:hypothetical protein
MNTPAKELCGNKILVILSVVFLCACNGETRGEYRQRISIIVCECNSSENIFTQKKDLADGNQINAMSKGQKGNLLKAEEKSIALLSECMLNKKLSKNDITYFWNNYDFKKMPLCDSAFLEHYRYIYNLEHGSF